MTRRSLAAGLLASACGALLGVACRKPAAPPSPAVAHFSGGMVTAADIDQAVLDLPQQRRQPEDGDLLAWYERIAREIAVQRLLLAEARQAGLDRDPEFLRAATEVRKQAIVDAFLEKDLPRPGTPSESELRAFYDEHRAEFQVDQARLTQHIFRRLAPGADPRAVVAEVQRLRARAVAGEDFSTLAAEHSESESRHQKGVLGWVSPGQLAPDLDRTIFSLKVGVPSEPIRTREGVHLFLVSAERPRKAFSFPELRPLILRRMLAERFDAGVRQRVGDALPEGSFVADDQQLRRIVAEADPEALVARIGDAELSVGELQRRLAAAATLDPSLRSASPLLFVAQFRQRELVYRYCVEHGLDRRPEVEARQQRLLDRELMMLVLRRKLTKSVGDDVRQLEEYYRSNRARFSEPLRLRVQKLLVPLSGNANDAMARLERARVDLDQGGQTLASLAAALDGRVEEPAWTTPSALARSDPRAMAFVLELRPGQHSPPFRTSTDIVLVRLVERGEPQPLSFDKARDRVRDDYLAAHRHDLLTALSAEMLGKARFEVLKAPLEALLKRPTADDGP